MSKRIIIASVAVAAVLLVVGALLFRGAKPTPASPRVDALPVAAPPAPKVCSPAWSCGRLARGEAGMKPGAWYLKYQDVGGPVQLELVFVAGASCHVNGVVADCASMNPPSGSGSAFSGSQDGDTFRVTKLDFTTR